jgi:hypothetical protein
MSINIHRNVYTAVAHLTLDVFRMFSLGNEETGVSVSQVMDPNPRQSGSPEGREESSIKEIGGIFWGFHHGGRPRRGLRQEGCQGCWP